MEKTELYKEIQEKYKELDNLRHKLERSFCIQSLWKNAFKNGKVYTSFSGNLNDLKSLKLVIKNDKEKRKFNILEVPEILFFSQIDTQIQGKTGYDFEIWKKVTNYYMKQRK